MKVITALLDVQFPFTIPMQDYPDDETLLQQLGGVYAFQGGVMIRGEIRFGVDSLKAKVFSPSAIALFLIGISLNLAVV